MLENILQAGSYELQVGEQSGPIKAKDLEKFLDSFQEIYSAAIAFLSYEENNVHSFYAELANEVPIEHKALIQKFQKFTQLSGAHRYHPWKHRNTDRDWEFDGISTNSPIKFIGYCTGVSLLALSLSVAAAGGEVDLRTLKFKVGGLVEVVRAIDHFVRD